MAGKERIRAIDQSWSVRLRMPAPIRSESSWSERDPSSTLGTQSLGSDNPPKAFSRSERGACPGCFGLIEIYFWPRKAGAGPLPDLEITQRFTLSQKISGTFRPAGVN